MFSITTLVSKYSHTAPIRTKSFLLNNKDMKIGAAYPLQKKMAEYPQSNPKCMDIMIYYTKRLCNGSEDILLGQME